MRLTGKILTLCLFISPAYVVAEEDTRFSLNTWVSQGETRWQHDASKENPRWGVPSSELDYQDVNSNVLEVQMHSTLPSGYELSLSIGAGWIESGLLVDDDYLSASGAVYYSASKSGNHRFSRTHSDINGNILSFFNGSFSPKDFIFRNGRHDLRFGFALHYWHEEYTATGVRQIECTTSALCSPAGSSSHAGETVITNKVEWTGFGVGLDYELKLLGNLLVQLDLTYYPLMSLKNEDTHHLRGDLAQDPSISMTGNGTGYDMLAGFKLNLSDRASAHIGYRVWQRYVQNQTITFHFSDGTSSSSDLMEFKTRRDGFIAGFIFQFQ